MSENKINWLGSAYKPSYFAYESNEKIFKKIDTKEGVDYWIRYDRGASIEKVLECCCLAHDIGHPPFAHAGEKELRENPRFRRTFDSNIQNIRILSTIGTVGRINNVEVTNALLDSILKHKPCGPFDNFVFNSEEICRIIKASNDTKTFISHEKFIIIYDCVLKKTKILMKLII